jgi:hypothetical protein
MDQPPRSDEGNNEEKNNNERIKTIGHLSFNSLISTLSEKSKQDLVNALLDSLTLKEQDKLLEDLSQRVNNGVRTATKAYHYVIVNCSLCRSLTKLDKCLMIYDRCQHYVLEDRLEIVFVKAGDVSCKTTSYDPALHTFFRSPEYELLQEKFLEKDPVGGKFLNGICFKLDESGIKDPATNTHRLIQEPMYLSRFHDLMYMICEASTNEEYDPLSDDEQHRITHRYLSESIEFTIEVNGQQRNVLYWSFK